MLPRDPMILLSVVNTRLRDEYSDLADLCAGMDVKENDLTAILGEIGYEYDRITNQFI